MHVFFDLDGTLTDSGEGVMRCLEHALGKLGRPIPSRERLRTWVGPALPVAFRSLLQATLAALQHDGHRMQVVTMKPQPYAIKILQHFEIDGFFEAVHGPTLQDRAP